MKVHPQTTTLAAALVSAMLLSSPAAFAGDKEEKEHRHYRGDQAALCEKLDRNDWEPKRHQFREKAREHHEEVASRLQLTDEQRKIWDDMHEERQQKYQRRFETLQERCKNLPKE